MPALHIKTSSVFLYEKSVTPWHFAGWIQGFEPWAFRATIWRANQLRYIHHYNFSLKRNVSEGIRTPDPRLRRPLLYPTELLTHITEHKLPSKSGWWESNSILTAQILIKRRFSTLHPPIVPESYWSTQSISEFYISIVFDGCQLFFILFCQYFLYCWYN